MSMWLLMGKTLQQHGQAYMWPRLAAILLKKYPEYSYSSCCWEYQAPGVLASNSQEYLESHSAEYEKGSSHLSINSQVLMGTDHLIRSYLLFLNENINSRAVSLCTCFSIILHNFVHTEITAPIVKLDLRVSGDVKHIGQAKLCVEFP